MKTFFGLFVLIILAFGGYWFWLQMPKATSEPTSTVSGEVTETPNPALTIVGDTTNVLGKSVQGRDIGIYKYGKGTKEVVFIGGMHGGYSWNTSLVAFELMEYLEKNPTAIPAQVKVTVIPVMNPDGLNLVVGTTSRFTKADVSTSQSTRTSGRFNAKTVDLNRNFDCDWKAGGMWQNTTVSGGTAAFSEPESQALKYYMETNKPTAVVVWYSSAGGVFPSKCGGSPSAETLALTDTFAKASGYPAFADFDFYEVTGDMPNWLAKIGVPAISVLLTNHEDTDWTKNQKGIDAILKRYAQ